MCTNQDNAGYLYILCFDRPLGDLSNPKAQASHYLGWALDVRARAAQHAAGRGAAITRAAAAQGITWAIFYRPGDRQLERHYKARYKSTPTLCPRCAERRGRQAPQGFQPLAQLALPLAWASAEQGLADPFEAAPAPALRGDWLEFKIQRDWRASAHALAPAGAMYTDDLL